jgi:hypothetical protein
MVAPSPKVRGLVLLRDGQTCVACGSRTSPLEMQHRQRVGAGGSNVRPQPHELATACALCNMRFESDMQTLALGCGWKVRAWVKDPRLVPMFNRPRGAWGLLTPEGGVARLSPAAAIAQMREVYGPEEWDRWADKSPLLVGMKGKVS